MKMTEIKNKFYNEYGAGLIEASAANIQWFMESTFDKTGENIYPAIDKYLQKAGKYCPPPAAGMPLWNAWVKA